MKFTKSIYTIDSHTAGEPTRIVVGGLPKIQGDSVAEKRDYVEKNMDYIRNFLCNEPRGHAGMYGAILTEPSNENADKGVIFFGPAGYDDMCGHASMGVAVLLIETGMMVSEEPITKVRLETPAGLVQINVGIIEGKIKSASLVSIPAFLYKEDMFINVNGYGKIKGDIAFGGNWFFYVNAKEIGIKVKSENVYDLIKAGSIIKNHINKEFTFIHPSDPNISKKLLGVSIVDSSMKNRDADQNNIVVISKGKCDRSPCGTGTCGRMAVLFSKNKLRLNQYFINEGISGTIFRGKLVKRVQIGKYQAVLPEIESKAYITGFNHFVLDPEDPFSINGFLLG